jgi:hypothetical protein
MPLLSLIVIFVNFILVIVVGKLSLIPRKEIPCGDVFVESKVLRITRSYLNSNSSGDLIKRVARTLYRERLRFDTTTHPCEDAREAIFGTNKHPVIV